MTDLPQSARRVLDRARDIGLAVTVLELPDSTRSAQDAARACDCDVAQIVKSLVFVGAHSGKPCLLLVSGANRVDEAAFAGEFGEALVRPDAGRVREITGYAIGGIPPLGHETPMDTFMDEALMAHEIVWAAAGTPRCVFSVSPKALAEATQARMARFPPL